ncbi:MAG: TIR domain-containing protein [Chloroflexota bacterium]
MIFVSHATSDDEFVNHLVEDLAIYGFPTWVDHRDMPAGSRWVAHLEQALRESDVMILICSEASMESSYVEAEWHAYFDMKKPVIPVRIDDCRVPTFLRTLHQLDFRDFDAFRKNVASLIEILATLSEKTLPSKAVTGFLADGLPDEQEHIDAKVNYILDELAPTFVTGTMQLILPYDEIVLQHALASELCVGRKSRTRDSEPMINLASMTNGALISRQHAIFHYVNNQLYIRDLGSTNGTYLDDERLEPNVDYPVENYALIYFSKQIPVVVRYQP